MLRTALLACVLAGGSALGAMGGWQEGAPSTRVERLAQYALEGMQGSLNSLDLQGAQLYEVQRYRSQVVSGINHEITVQTSAGSLVVKIYEQSWTNTLRVTSATLSSPVSQISMAITTSTLVDEAGEGLALDGEAFATLDAAAVAEEQACAPHDGPCTYDWNPLCANGVTYSNKCAARNACIFEAMWGACPEPSPEPSPDAPCVPNPAAVCTEEYMPKCGKDGVTYGNDCMARAACQADATPGECPAATPAPCVPNPAAMCPMNWAPLCGKNGRTYSNRCAAEAACQHEGATEGQCPMFPPPSPATTACVPNPAAVCTMDWRPVCGKNGRTYSNMCGARAACQHEGATEGECASSPPPSPTACVPNPMKPCTMEYMPLCGRDGVTYGNRCMAQANCQLEGATEGECAISSPSPAACVPHTGACTREFRPMCGKNGKTYPNPCHARNACQFDATEGACNAPPVEPAVCVPHNGPCTREFRPMCGKDGVTYANPCLARNACQHDATEGPCPDLSPPPTGSAWGSMLVGGAPIGNGGNAGGHYTGSDSQLLGGWAAQTKIGAGSYVHHLAHVAVTELKAKSQVQGELVRVVSAQSQMVAGTNYLIVAEVGAPVSVLTLKIFEQKWTSTLQLTAATRGEGAALVTLLGEDAALTLDVTLLQQLEAAPAPTAEPTPVPQPSSTPSPIESPPEMVSIDGQSLTTKAKPAYTKAARLFVIFGLVLVAALAGLLAVAAVVRAKRARPAPSDTPTLFAGPKSDDPEAARSSQAQVINDQKAPL